MLRRNPDLIATIVVAVYLALGSASAQFLIEWHRQPAFREEVRDIVREGVRSVLRELAFTFRN